MPHQELRHILSNAEVLAVGLVELNDIILSDLSIHNLAKDTIALSTAELVNSSSLIPGRSQVLGEVRIIATVATVAVSEEHDSFPLCLLRDSLSIMS